MPPKFDLSVDTDKIDIQMLNEYLLADDNIDSLSRHHEDQPITETEGYKAWLQLLQLVYKDDKTELTKKALA